MATGEPVVLLIESDLGDQEIFRRAIKHGFMKANLRIVSNGSEALDYLGAKGKTKHLNNTPSPDLIILDLHVSGLSGLETLSRIREIDAVKNTPILIYTTVDSMADVVKSYELGANTYIAKSSSYEDLTRKLKIIDQYWFDISVLPFSKSA